MPLPHLCQVISVDDIALPDGHNFVIVRLPSGRCVVYARQDDRSQLEARIAFLEWDRQFTTTG